MQHVSGPIQASATISPTISRSSNSSPEVNNDGDIDFKEFSKGYAQMFSGLSERAAAGDDDGNDDDDDAAATEAVGEDDNDDETSGRSDGADGGGETKTDDAGGSAATTAADDKAARDAAAQTAAMKDIQKQLDDTNASVRAERDRLQEETLRLRKQVEAKSDELSAAHELLREKAKELRTTGAEADEVIDKIRREKDEEIKSLQAVLKEEQVRGGYT